MEQGAEGGSGTAACAEFENLTNQHYETTYQYGTLGCAAYAGVRLSF